MMICSNMLVYFLESYIPKNQTAITSEEALKSIVTAVYHLRGNVKYLNNNEQSEEIPSQQAKRPRRAATHASVSHLQLQSCVTEACDTITEEVKENFGYILFIFNSESS